MRTVDTETLEITERPVPELREGEVLVRVAGAGVNRADLLQRAGSYPPPRGASTVLGLECSGHVERLGPGVPAGAEADVLRGWGPGSPVVALLAGGGYAEFVAVPHQQLLPAEPVLGPGLDLVAAGALVEAAATAWANMVQTGNLHPAQVPGAPQTVLVQGGSGGVGHVAVQIAHALGARVLATAGGPERAARVRGLGAEAIDHRSQDVPEAVAEATDGRGVDLVLDVLGGGALNDNVGMLAQFGTLAVISFQQGARGELDLARLARRRGSVVATYLRSRTPAQKGEVLAGVREHVWPLVAGGSVRPVIDEGHRLPAAEAARAHDALEKGEVFGKVVLEF